MRLGLSVCMVAGVGCGLLVDLPEEIPENGLWLCQDQLDNDFDGLTDCADDDCDCNRCPEFVEEPPVVDALGQTCERDCECPDGMICNDRARDFGEDSQLYLVSRCAPDADPVEDAFDIHFTMEMTQGEGSGSLVTTGASNVFGRVRLDGTDVTIHSTEWLGGEGEFAFRSPRESNEEQVLFFFLFPRPRPAMNAEARFFIADDIQPLPPAPNETQTKAADYGPVFSGEDPSDLGQNQRAVVQTGILTFEPLSEVTDGYWRGRVSGELRAATSFDRARTCPARDRKAYDADIGGCAEPAPDQVSFYLGCAFQPTPVRGWGDIAFAWFPWWSSSTIPEIGAGGECTAIRDGDRVRLRAQVDGTALGATLDWMLELDLPRFRVVENVGIEIGPELGVTAGIWRRSRPDGDVSFFDLELGPPDRVVSGQIRIDDIREGPDGRFLGWVNGFLEEPPPAP